MKVIISTLCTACTMNHERCWLPVTLSPILSVHRKYQTELCSWESSTQIYTLSRDYVYNVHTKFEKFYDKTS